MPAEHALNGFFDYRLVALSVLLAILASYAALDLAGRVTASRGTVRVVWLTGGAAAMGLGIWSMHYIGMLAYTLPCQVLYDWPTVLVSLMAAMLASGIALTVASQEEMGVRRIGLGGVLMGMGIAGMHYIGMEAMRLPAMCHYSRGLVAISVALAIAISWAALWLTFHLRDENKTTRLRKFCSALVMGAAIPVMHYTGMAAASFEPRAMAGDLRHAVEMSSLGTMVISSVTTIILGLTILTSLVDRRWAAQAAKLQALVEDSQVVRESLAQTEERFRLAVRSSGIVVWNWDIDRNLIEAEENCEVVFGLPASQFPRTVEAFGELVHREDRERIGQEIAAALAGSEYDTEFQVVWPDGTIRSVAARGKVYYSEEGRPRRMTGVTWDVSDRRQTEEKLRTTAKRLVAAAKFRELLDAAPDAVVVVNQEGQIVLVNTQTEMLFGYRREELLGEKLEVLVPERAKTGHARYRDAFFADPKVRDMGAGRELLGRKKDGSEFAAEIRLSRLETDEGVLVSGAIRDITERKRSEQQILNLNRKLEEAATEAGAANRAKSIFLSTMSHEIRTPMNAILGYAQLMSRDPSLGADAKANLKIIGRSGEHLLALINDVLDMSKIEAGRVEVRAVNFSLSTLLEDIAAMFRQRAEAKALRFEMLVDGEAEPYLVGDEAKIRQTLINLLGNAVKFAERGKVKLHVTLERRSAGNLWFVARVEDTGPGIAQDQQAELFKPFRQAKDRINTQEGTGLGLAISRNFARLMGGDITLASSAGEGSRFRFEVPVERGSSGVAEKRSTQRRVIGLRAATRIPRLLVVDDRLENRDWLVKLLTAIGFSVRDAVNGEEAVRSWEEWNPDLILMDLHMPVMDGLEATRRIKAHERGKATVVIALTASVLEGDRQMVLASSADDFLAKPCREEELLEKVREHLRVEYEYEAESVEEQPALSVADLSAEQLQRLPVDLLEELRGAIVSGNKRLIDKVIQKIHEAKEAALADALQELADKYEYDFLTQLLAEAQPQ